MAEGTVGLPPDGTGTKLRMITNPAVAAGAQQEVVTIADSDGTLVGVGTLLAAIRRGVTDFEVQLDYDVRTDGSPVYVGKNVQGASTSAATWSIQKLTYDGSNRLTRVEVLTGAWTNRASLAW